MVSEAASLISFIIWPLALDKQFGQFYLLATLMELLQRYVLFIPKGYNCGAITPSTHSPVLVIWVNGWTIYEIYV